MFAPGTDTLHNWRMKVGANILDAIGNTPLIELTALEPEGSARILAKLEWSNPTGSMKDRMACAAIRAAIAKGDLKPGDTIVEYTGGTTGVSLALVAAALGYKLEIVYSDAFSEDKGRMMRALGANLTYVNSNGKGITAGLIKEMIACAKEIGERPNHWWFDQLNNHDGFAGYTALGDEIWNQTGGRVDAFVQSVGTAHSIHGVSAALRKHGKVRVTAVEPAESAVLSGGQSGSHRIEGIGIGFVPPLWGPQQVDEIIPVSTEDAQATARRIAKEAGVFAGTSSGANVFAAQQVAKKLGPGKTVVTIMVDSGLRYLSTDLYRTQES
jgi:cysteine synthase A